MQPAPCLVIDGEQRWKGNVLAWRRDDASGWIGLVRFTVWTPEGWPMTYEHTVPAERLEHRPV